MKSSFVCLFLALAFVFAGCGKAPQKPAQDTLKVGLILPLTGGNAFYGKDALDAALLWKKEHPNAPIELKVEDGEMQAVKSLNAALKLAQWDKVNVLFTMDANTGRAIKRVANQYKVIQICQAWDPKISDGKYNIVTEFQPPDAAAVLVNYLVSQNIKRIAVFYMNNVAFSICANEVEKAAREKGLEIVSSTHFPPGITDFRIELLKIKEKNPEILVLLSFPPESNIIEHHLKQIGWNVPLTSINSFEQSGEYALWNGCVSVGSIDLKGEFAKKFFAEYKRQTVYPGFTYDMLTLLNNAYEKCGRDVSKLPETVQASTPFKGIIGEAVNDNGTFKYKPFLVKMVNGMPERVVE